MNRQEIDFGHIAAKLDGRVVVGSKYYYAELPRSLRELAFTVSNVETLNQIALIKQSLETARREGLSFQDWQNELDREAIKHLSQARLETVYRTNLHSTYTQSLRYNAASAGVTPYLMFRAVGDSRTRESHLELDGIIKKADSPFWNKYTPPLGYNCRCWLIPLTKEEAKSRGISRIDESKLPQPDPRFGERKIGDVLSHAYKSADRAINDLPKNSIYRTKFIEAQDRVKNLVDVWYQEHQTIFERE